MNVEYTCARALSPDEFVDLLERSTLAERRPVDDAAVVRAMLDEADLLVTAWEGERLVGVARSVTDFAYCCYLSDLAVDAAVQGRGVGRGLIEATRARLGPKATLILLSAPKALGYYPRIGMQKHEGAFVLPPGAELAQ